MMLLLKFKNLQLINNPFSDAFSKGVNNLIIMKHLFAFLVSLFVTIGLAIAITSCNVTRRVTTESSYYQRGDTSCTITVKTVETYDATKKLPQGN